MRLNAVEAFQNDALTADELAEELDNVRIWNGCLSKLSYQSFNARDSLALRAFAAKREARQRTS